MTDIHTPAHAFIGPSNAVITAAHEFIVQRLSPCNNCKSCYICTAISQQQHHALLWLCPEKSYTKELIEPVFKKLAFSRGAHEPYFIVLEKADCLSIACANSLLKSLEEPPANYFFLLLSTNENVLPTLLSRCTIHTIAGEQPEEISTVITLLTQAKRSQMPAFSKEIERAKINENNIPSIIEHMLNNWITYYKRTPTNRALVIINYLSSLLPLPIMPGSTKLYLRTVFLTLCSFDE